MTEQGEGQKLSDNDRFFGLMFDESDAPPVEDALSHSVPREAVAGLPMDYSSMTAQIEEAEEDMLTDMLDGALRQYLNDREAQVLRMRFGLEDGQVKTLSEVGKAIGRSTSTA